MLAPDIVDVKHLTENDPVHSRRAEKRSDALDQLFVGKSVIFITLRHDLKCTAIKPHTRHQSDILTVNDMVGRLASAHGVIVHARQIVVNERIRMYYLDGAGERGRFFPISAAQTAAFKGKNGTNALSARHDAVTH